MSRSSLSSRNIENLIRKQVNKALHDAGMNPSTRRGNKELKHLIGRLAQTSIPDADAATELGNILGQQILDVSEKKGKKNLDQGVVIQVIAAGNLPVVEPEPVVVAATPSPVAAVAEPETPAEPEASSEPEETTSEPEETTSEPEAATSEPEAGPEAETEAVADSETEA